MTNIPSILGSIWECICTSGVFPYWPSAERVSPDDDQAVSSAFFDPVVHVEGISSQPGFSRLSGGVSKTCRSLSRRLLFMVTSESWSWEQSGHKVAVTQRKTLVRHWPKAELISFDCLTTNISSSTTKLVHSDYMSANDIKSMWKACVLQSI